MPKRQRPEMRTHWTLLYDDAKAHLQSSEMNDALAKNSTLPGPPLFPRDISLRKLREVTESLMKYQKNLKGKKATRRLQLELHKQEQVNAILEGALSLLNDEEASAFINHYKLRDLSSSQQAEDATGTSTPSLETISNSIVHYCTNLLWLERTLHIRHHR